MCWHLPKVNENSMAGWLGNNGLWGVDLFFVLSGFLIANQLFRSLANQGRFSFKQFYIRRIFRTWPNYFVVFLLYFFIPAVWEQPVMPPAWKFLTFTQNFGLGFSAFSHAWSLCIEEQFYLVFPVIALALWRVRDRHLAIGTVLFVLIGGMIVRGALWLEFVQANTGQYFSMIYYPTWGRLDGLVLGVSIAAIKNFLPGSWMALQKYGNGILLGGLLILVLGFRLQGDRLQLTSTILGFPIVALGFMCLVIAALSPQSILARVKIPGASAISTLAFSLYLLHKQVFHLTGRLLDRAGIQGQIPFLILSLFASFLAASVLYMIIERPFLKIRDRLSSHQASIVNGLK